MSWEHIDALKPGETGNRYTVYTYLLEPSPCRDESGEVVRRYRSQPIAYMRRQTDSPDLIVVVVTAASALRAKLAAEKWRRAKERRKP